MTSDISYHVPVSEPSSNLDARGHRARIHSFHAIIETVRYTVVLKCPTDDDGAHDMRSTDRRPSSFIAAAVWIRIRALRHRRELPAFSIRCGDNESIHWWFNVIRQTVSPDPRKLFADFCRICSFFADFHVDGRIVVLNKVPFGPFGTSRRSLNGRHGTAAYDTCGTER